MAGAVPGHLGGALVRLPRHQSRKRHARLNSEAPTKHHPLEAALVERKGTVDIDDVAAGRVEWADALLMSKESEASLRQVNESADAWVGLVAVVAGGAFAI